MIEGLNYAGAIQGGISQPEAFRQKMEYETQLKQHLGAEQKREGQLTRQLQHLEKNVITLCSVVDDLNTKLSPLTVPVPEKEQKEQAGYAHDATPSSEVASFLDRMNGQILLVIRRLNSTTREIDL